jgi:hypothetical protein
MLILHAIRFLIHGCELLCASRVFEVAREWIAKITRDDKAYSDIKVQYSIKIPRMQLRKKSGLEQHLETQHLTSCLANLPIAPAVSPP